MTKELREWFRTIGQKGGLKGGAQTAKNMTAEQRRVRAQKAARARWTKAKKKARG